MKKTIPNTRRGAAWIKWTALAISTALAAGLLGGCAQNAATTSSVTAGNTVTTTLAARADSATAETAVTVNYTDRDLNATVDVANAVTVQCSGTTASISGGSGATAAEGYLTITKAGTYRISGSLSGQIVVDAGDDDKIQIVAEGISVTSDSGPAVWIQNADKVFFTLAEGTENSLADSADDTLAEGESAPNACLYSKADLTINGSGALKIEGNNNHGIYSKDDLKICGGTISVHAVNDGIKGKDCVAIYAGDITILAGGDGIQASNTEDASLGWVSIDGGSLDITADGDGIQAETVLQLTPETLCVTAGGGSANAAEKTLANDGFGGRGGNKPDDAMQGGFAPDTSTEYGGRGGKAGMADGADAATGATQPQRQADPTGGEPPAIPAPAATTESAQSAETTDDAESTSTKGLKAGTTLLVRGGTITVDAADDALHANGNVTVAGGYLTLASGDDGVHADETTTVLDGNIEITNCYEGLEGKAVLVTGGCTTVTASDDGVNAAGGNDFSGFGRMGAADSFASDDDTQSRLEISGGVLVVNAGGDGLDSNGTLTVSGGVVLVSGPSGSGNGALDTGTAASVTGGIVIAAGSVGMAVNFDSTSTQASWLASTGSQTGGTTLSLLDENGKVLLSWTPENDYACAVVSCPVMQENDSYTLVCGGSVTGGSAVAGTGEALVTGGSVSGGNEVAAVTMASISVSDLSGGMGNMRGGQGGTMKGTAPGVGADAAQAAPQQSDAATGTLQNTANSTS